VEADDGDREPRRQVRLITARRVRDAALLTLFGALLAAVVVAPLTRKGWLLTLDWVPGPDGFGTEGNIALPTGPAFLLPAHAAHAMFGAAVGWLPIGAAIAVAAVGAAALVGGPWAARITAGVAFAWNPFVYDRVYVGQVSVLAAYALLPWLAFAGLRIQRARGAVIVGLVFALAISCTVHDAWIGGVLVVAVAIARVPRDGVVRVLAGLAIAASVTALVVGAWLLPARDDAPPQGDERVLDVFATSRDADLGRSLGLLAQQGFWRVTEERPRDDLGRAFPFIAGATIAAAVAGLVLARGTPDGRLAAAVALAGVTGWLLAHGVAGPSGRAYRWMFDTVPGFGVMREAQKWNALVSLAIAVGIGLFGTALVRAELRAVAWVAVALPVALAPTLAWGLTSRLEPSRYPEAWARVQPELASVDGDVVVLPWEQYVLPGFTGNRTVEQPAPSYFGPVVVTSRNAGVDGLDADIGRRALIADALRDARADGEAGRTVGLSGDLRDLGIAGVLVLGSDDGVPLADDEGLRRTHEEEDLALWVVEPSD
jgi:hypothetical protein